MGATPVTYTDDNGCTSSGYEMFMAYITTVPGSQAEYRDEFTLFFNTSASLDCNSSPSDCSSPGL